jgi:Skp family chaperone for outer membrane proteins
MKTLFISASFVASLIALPTAALAQAAPSVLVVDTESLMQNCTACRAANSELVSQANALQTRRNTLASQFDTEAKTIDDEAKALNGKPAGPALKAKAQSLQTRERQAQDELQNSADQLRSTQAHVQQQIGEKIVQIAEQVRTQRRAAVVLSKNATLANDSTADITGQVLAALNQQLPSVSVTPMPRQQNQPQGR